ncbi:DNA Metabolism [Methylobacterium phyllosphaerae]|uniref:DNA Metabolism n=1 Tax=Methylobacterium phyllosphaerae TaxID=418223 RepID=A0AAE8HSJ0_9HYPH|nr:primase-helicase family protein [Methylobacterium phyllosphaerae]APT31922.1 DNA Metabolism [Methylobacterium phyllosphaerae]SFH01515.1 hypothetical protein SAMN05192567_11236 [Methylobacterium phyllosphaerae]
MSADDPTDRIARIIADAAEPELDAVDDVGAPFDDVAEGDSDAPVPDEDGDAPLVPRAMGFDVERMNQEFALVLMGSKAVIMQQQSEGPIEDRVKLLTLDAFRAWFMNRPTEHLDKDGKIKRTTWAAAWLVARSRRQYRGIEFFPDPDNAPNTEGYFNLWQGFTVTPRAKSGGYSIFYDHLLTNVCGGSKTLATWVFGWFAHIVQRPRERIGTALVFRGKMGTGKSTIGEVMGSLIASHYFLVDDPRYLVGQFNAHMASCLLLQADEGFWAGDKAAEGRLKGLVTAETQMIESKGVDPIRLKNYVRLLITSNNDWVIPAGKDERRFGVIDVGDGCAQNGEYFAELHKQLADGGREALLHDLLHFDLTSVNLRQIPKTEALLEQKLRSLDAVESWWFERLAAGTPTAKMEYWRCDMPIDEMFDDYIASADKIGIKRKSEITSFGIKMRRLVPGLKRERLSVSDGHVGLKRLWCYVLPPLDDARALFETELSQAVAWDDDPKPGETGS